MQKIKVYMGIPSTGDRWDVQEYALRAIQRKYADRIEFVYPEVFCSRIFHDYARNQYVEQFLASDCDVIWFLDSDICPHTDVLNLLIDHFDKWDVAGAPYPVFMTPKGYDSPQVVFTAYSHDGNGFHPTQIPQSGTDFIDGIATGCLFIKKSVFSKLKAPYFEFKYSPETRELIEGEDLGFCRKIRELGTKFFIDYGLVCKHQKKIDLLDVNNYAIQYANNAVLAYDRSIRQRLVEKQLSAAPSRSRLILP